jgi:hypothetical protein
MKNSEFRKKILVFCKTSFEKFFDKDEREKAEGDEEKKIMF